jgi:hypothetical protein
MKRRTRILRETSETEHDCHVLTHVASRSPSHPAALFLVDFPPRLPDISASPAKDWAVLPSLHLLLAVWRFVRVCILSVAWLSLRLNVSISGNHEKADRTLCEPLSEGLDLSFVFLILLRQLLVRLRQQRFKMLDPLISD